MSVFGLLFGAMRDPQETVDCPLEELPEFGAIDFRKGVDIDLDFLPWTTAVLAVDPLTAAVDGQVFQVVQWLERQVGDELIAAKGVAGGVELELQQPRFAGDGVQEPAVGFAGGGDFDHAAGIPIGRTEFAQLVDSLFDQIEDLAIPLGCLAVPTDPLRGVPASAVDFPRHLGVATDVGDVDVASCRGVGGRRVVDLASSVGSGFEDRCEEFAGVRPQRPLERSTRRR